MSEEQSKRDRQKQRRESKRQAEQQRLAQARRKRLMAIGGVVVLGIAALGFVLQGQIAERREAAERQERTAERLTDLGCTPVEQEDVSGGGQHIAQTNLAQYPPDALYDTRPPSHGPHTNEWTTFGVFEEPVDERLVVHNLEHGFVVFWHSEDAPEDQVAELREFAREQLDGDYPKITVTPWPGEYAGDHNFSFTSWGKRQDCREFDAEVALTYLEQNHGLDSDAPEATLPASGHAPGARGVLAPEEGQPLLFPPLDAQAEEEDAPTS